MIQTNAPADPELHKAACCIARRVTEMLVGLLRDTERGECQRETYLICREILDELAIFKGK